MNLIQWLIAAFILYMLYGLFRKLKKREMNIQLFILWLIFWAMVSVMALEPRILNYLADKVGVGRGVDVAIYVSILVLFYAVFRILIRLEKIDKYLAEIIRRISLNNSKNDLNNNRANTGRK